MEINRPFDNTAVFVEGFDVFIIKVGDYRPTCWASVEDESEQHWPIILGLNK